ARVSEDPGSGRFQLLRAVDEDRDQTYFLWGLTQAQLRHAHFPLGAMLKPAVRARAVELGLAVAEKPDSHEICFVPGNDYGAFLSAYAAEQHAALPDPEGELVTSDGRVLGAHAGIQHFTVGQRKGLGVAVGKPLYVLQLDPARNRVTVGDGAGLMARSLRASGCSWISGEAPAQPIRVSARIRHRHQPAPAWAEALPGGMLRVDFDESQRAITPGQAVVLSQGEVVLGGAWIDASAR
ncbi:MAG: MnmA/TRMU family protein, partial [Terriglobales bacterium]